MPRGKVSANSSNPSGESVENSAGFLFVGQHPALDFVNTEIVADGKRQDLLQSFADLTNWLEAAGMAGKQDVQTMLENIPLGKRDGALYEARELRSVLRGLAGSLAGQKPPKTDDIHALNAVLAAQNVHEFLVLQGGKYALKRLPDWSSINGMLSPIAREGAYLLTECDPSMLKRCEGSGCILFFYDTTRNHSRLLRLSARRPRTMPCS